MAPVVEYVREDGSNPFREWFDQLGSRAAAKVAAAITRLRSSNTSNLKRIGAIGEYRIDWGPGYRIYLAQARDASILLLGGGTKRGQRADIRRTAMFDEYKTRAAIGREL